MSLADQQALFHGGMAAGLCAPSMSFVLTYLLFIVNQLTLLLLIDRRPTY
jgi:hypothetical protein